MVATTITRMVDMVEETAEEAVEMAVEEAMVIDG
jgi:hypothetical protein